MYKHQIGIASLFALSDIWDAIEIVCRSSTQS